MKKSKFYQHKNKTAGLAKRTVKNVQDGDKIHAEYTFDSEDEADYYREVIQPKLDSGEIVNVHLQPKAIIQEPFKKYGKTHQKIEYIPDFLIIAFDSIQHYVDVKGTYTRQNADPVALLKRKLFDYKYPDAVLQWVCYSKQDGGWVDWDFYCKNENKRKKLRDAGV